VVVTKAGGKFVMPETLIPGIGYSVYPEDTERNLFRSDANGRKRNVNSDEVGSLCGRR
jgi:hypothetical protein